MHVCANPRAKVLITSQSSFWEIIWTCFGDIFSARATRREYDPTISQLHRQPRQDDESGRDYRWGSG